MVIELPFPPSVLNPNNKNGKHWATTNAAKAKYRNDCWVLAMQSSRGYVPPDGPIALRLTFVQPPNRRRADVDNLLASCKAGIDGLAAALKVDDSRFEPMTICRAFGRPGKVVVEVA
jgi:crossover junction endodeoxyribonuclease RusA